MPFAVASAVNFCPYDISAIQMYHRKLRNNLYVTTLEKKWPALSKKKCLLCPSVSFYSCKDFILFVVVCFFLSFAELLNLFNITFYR